MIDLDKISLTEGLLELGHMQALVRTSVYGKDQYEVINLKLLMRDGLYKRLYLGSTPVHAVRVAVGAMRRYKESGEWNDGFGPSENSLVAEGWSGDRFKDLACAFCGEPFKIHPIHNDEGGHSFVPLNKETFEKHLKR